jgi:uncharacterized C2H2 Zn-finger protein
MVSVTNAIGTRSELQSPRERSSEECLAARVGDRDGDRLLRFPRDQTNPSLREIDVLPPQEPEIFRTKTRLDRDNEELLQCAESGEATANLTSIRQRLPHLAPKGAAARTMDWASADAKKLTPSVR